MTSGSGLFEANKATCALINYGDSVSLTSYKLDFEYGNNSAIANPEYLLINTPQLKKHHVRSPKFGLFCVFKLPPFQAATKLPTWSILGVVSFIRFQ